MLKVKVIEVIKSDFRESRDSQTWGEALEQRFNDWLGEKATRNVREMHQSVLSHEGMVAIVLTILYED